MFKPSNDTEKEIARLITRHMAGTLTPQQEQQLDHWLMEDDDNIDLFEKLIDRREQKWANAWLKQRGTKIPRGYHKRTKLINYKMIAMIAACCIAGAGCILIAIIAFFSSQGPSPKNYAQRIAGINRLISPALEQAILFGNDGKKYLFGNSPQKDMAHKISVTKNKIHTIEVPAGSKSAFLLPDETTVWLKPGTRLVLARGFNDNTRSVELYGEGFFKVADRENPFIIKTTNINIISNQSELNIKAYPEDSIKKILLTKGDATIFYGRQATVLDAYIEIVINNKNEKVTGHGRGITTTDFIYEKVPLADVMKDMSRWYNLPVIYQAGNKEFTGAIESIEPINKVLSKIKKYSKVNFTTRRDTLIVSDN